MLQRPKQNGFPGVYESNGRLSIAHEGKTNTEMETIALNATKKRSCMPTRCILIKLLPNKKSEVILWGIVVACCSSWV